MDRSKHEALLLGFLAKKAAGDNFDRDVKAMVQTLNVGEELSDMGLDVPEVTPALAGMIWGIDIALRCFPMVKLQGLREKIDAAYAAGVNVSDEDDNNQSYITDAMVETNENESRKFNGPHCGDPTCDAKHTTDLKTPVLKESSQVSEESADKFFTSLGIEPPKREVA